MQNFDDLKKKIELFEKLARFGTPESYLKRYSQELKQMTGPGQYVQFDPSNVQVPEAPKAAPSIPAPKPATPTTVPVPQQHLTGRALFSFFQTLSNKIRSGQKPTLDEMGVWYANSPAFKGRMNWLEKMLHTPQEHTPEDVQNWQNEHGLIKQVVDQLG
jgi:hypothetical protein